MPEQIVVPTAAAMRALGRRLAALLRPGDLVLLAGPLGAGKTTLVQGLGEALRVRGRITSPTFVIARVHPALAGGPALVHVDAYRLGGLAEVEDLDLDLDGSVTVVEWGEGMAEGLSADRLEISIAFAAAGNAAAGAEAAGNEAAGAEAAGNEPSGAEAAGNEPSADEAPGDEARVVRISGTGARWASGARLDSLAG